MSKLSKNRLELIRHLTNLSPPKEDLQYKRCTACEFSKRATFGRREETTKDIYSCLLANCFYARVCDES